MGLFSRKTDAKGSKKPHGHEPNPTPPATVGKVQDEQFRSIFLLSYPSGTFKSHWAIMIPRAGAGRIQKGTQVHAIGNLKDGFELEIRRNFDIDATRTKPDTPIEIGVVPVQYIDGPEDEKYSKGSVPRDALERAMFSVPAPSKSLNSATGKDVSRFLFGPRVLNNGAEASGWPS